MRSAITTSTFAAATLLLAVPLSAAEMGKGGLRQQPLPSTPPSTERAPPAPQPEPSTRPATPRAFTYRGTRYLVREGQWFEQRGADYVAVAAPAGVMVKDLPAGYAMRWIGGAPYFYADGLYYVWRQPQRSYEILQLPPGKEAAADSEASASQ
jgi:hypothetical protein